MVLLILIGVVYVIVTESLPVAVVVAALILYRAHRPGQFWQRVREAWLARQMMEASVEDVRE